VILLELTKRFKAGSIVIDINPLRSVGGKQSAPHLKTTAYHMGWLDCDWIKILPAAALNAIKKRHINRMRALLRSNMVQILYPNSRFVVLDILEHPRM
jgi:hypothetical protein